jgi:hypothetical protein
MGALAQRHLTPDEALAVIVQGSGKRYDPAIVPVFVELLAAVAYADTAPAAVCETPVMASALQVGMVLSRDLITPSGLLMLSTDHLLDDRMIRKIIDFEKSAGLVLTAHVRVNLDS